MACFTWKRAKDYNGWIDPRAGWPDRNDGPALKGAEVGLA